MKIELEPFESEKEKAAFLHGLLTAAKILDQQERHRWVLNEEAERRDGQAYITKVGICSQAVWDCITAITRIHKTISENKENVISEKEQKTDKEKQNNALQD